MKRKQCSQCGKRLPESAFHTTKREPETRCKICVAAYLREWRKTRSIVDKGTRTCRVCKKRKPLVAFQGERSSKKGRSWRCYECQYVYQTQWRLKKRGDRPTYKRSGSLGGPFIVKQCDICAQPYEPASSLQKRCKPCQKYLRTRTQALSLCDDDRYRVVMALRTTRECQYCRDPLIDAIIEHMTPGAGDGLDNLTIACIPCNRGKGNSTAREYIERCARVAGHVAVFNVKTIRLLAG